MDKKTLKYNLIHKSMLLQNLDMVTFMARCAENKNPAMKQFTNITVATLESMMDDVINELCTIAEQYKNAR